MMRIGLALSGGGTRAAVFHLGVLRRLAVDGRLDQVSKLSTVSGGSLAAAMVFAHAGMAWPDSKDFTERTYPKLRGILTTTPLAGPLTLLRHLPTSPWLVLFHRARLVARLLESRWGVKGDLADLPDKPEWRANATCYETGKNWRFSRTEMGDWAFGRHGQPPFSLAEAAAASAAVPHVIGALKLRLPESGWYATDPATGRPTQSVARPAETVRLWDGGAYENLGLESLYKPGRGAIGCDFVLVSDASGPLTDTRKAGVTAGLSSPRLFDIASDQIRGLRSRMFVQALQSGEVAGALIRMGNAVRDIDQKAGRARDEAEYARFQTESDVKAALHHPTTLEAISEPEFERIARNGFELADAVLTAYCPAAFPVSAGWPG